MRNLPVGLPAGVTVATTQDVYPYAAAALGSVGVIGGAVLVAGIV
jgi:hypothetical protein